MTTHEFMGVKASAIAATALMMTRTLAGIEPWSEALAAYTQYSFDQLCGYCRIVHNILKMNPREESAFMRRKYGSDPFRNVASVPIPEELPIPFPLE
jgi:hypothetical protein